MTDRGCRTELLVDADSSSIDALIEFGLLAVEGAYVDTITRATNTISKRHHSKLYHAKEMEATLYIYIISNPDVKNTQSLCNTKLT